MEVIPVTESEMRKLMMIAIEKRRYKWNASLSLAENYERYASKPVDKPPTAIKRKPKPKPKAKKTTESKAARRRRRHSEYRERRELYDRFLRKRR